MRPFLKKKNKTLKWYKYAPQVKESMLIMNENIGQLKRETENMKKDWLEIVKLKP